MSPTPLAACEPARPLGGPPLALRANVTASFRLEIVPGLFRQDNRTLADAWFPARRLVVVCDAATGDRGELLASYLRAAQDRGQLDEHLILDAPPTSAAEGVVACDELLEAAAKVRLGRRDAFVAFGGAQTGELVAVAASCYRRWTRTIRVHRDLASVVAAIRDGVRVGLTGSPISALQRSSQVVADEEGVLGAAGGAAEHAALLLLGLIEHQALDRLGRGPDRERRTEALAAVLRLCQRFGPGDPAWLLGTAWQPLAPARVPPEHRPTWALLCAARVAHRLQYISDERLSAVADLLHRLDPELPGRLAALPDADAVRRWALLGRLGGREGHRVAVPRDDAEPALLNRSRLASVLAGLPALPHGASSAPGRGRSTGRRGPAGSRMAVAAHTDVCVPASFPVRFAAGLLDADNWDLTDLLPVGGQVLAAVDPYSADQVSRVHSMLARYRRHGYLSRFTVAPVHASDRAKTFDQVTRITQIAEGLGLGHDDRILVIGGGTVMDIVGYAAYLYRGDTPYIRLPTTLVGMIDAGIGLKVGVNVNGHKNLMGAYHPPMECVCDTAFLHTLAPEELRCGLAEAVKIAMVCDRGLFELIEARHGDLFTGAETAQARAILDGSIRTMLRQLEANPFEEELRRLPDFGHEFGHLLESMSRFRLRHGEAVAIGMSLSSCLAASVGYLAPADLDRLLGLLTEGGLPIFDPVCDPEVLWAKLRDDVVPHKGGRLHLVVPRAIGVGDFIDSLDDLDPQMLRDACARLRDREASRSKSPDAGGAR